MNIAGVGSAFPKHYYPQAVMQQALKLYWGPKLKSPGLFDQIYQHLGVEGRHTVLPLEGYPELKTWGEANNKWIEAAVDLGEASICRALQVSGVNPEELGALFFVTVTGVASPSIDAKLVNRMKLSRNIKRIPIFGLGCVAGAAGLARAADYVKAFPDQAVALLSVELCSLTIQLEDMSVANLISTGLFGDGAAAVIIGGSDRGLKGPEIINTRSIFYPETEGVMGWDISEKGFRIVLTRDVADMARQHLAGDVDCFLADQGMKRSDISTWIMHTGGPRVLEAVEESLQLTNGALKPSWESLRKVGNLSSASVLLVLEDVMKNHRPAPGTYSILAALGPGFCSELVLLKW
jgi:alkylresorcinol/alkylpyrone synthase